MNTKPTPPASGRRTKYLAVLLVIGLCGGLSAAVLSAAPKPPAPTSPPPAPVITEAPAARSNQRSATFAFRDARDGVAFRCRRDAMPFVPCTSPVTYAGPLAEGTHTFAVKAVDAGGQSSPTTATWRIDLTPAPAPVLTSTPSRPSVERTATFTFTDAEPGVYFRCRLDGSQFSPCTSGITYTDLAAGPHAFGVRVLDGAGNRSATTSFHWTILAQATRFTLAGSPGSTLYPGASATVDVRITNPYSYAIEVSGLTVTPKAATTRGGQPNPACNGTVNLTASRQYAGPSLVIPKKSTRSLSQLGIDESAWPEITMPNLPTNQDACQQTTFAFAYSATATKAVP